MAIKKSNVEKTPPKGTVRFSITLSGEQKTELMDKHLKEILIRLSQKST